MGEPCSQLCRQMCLHVLLSTCGCRCGCSKEVGQQRISWEKLHMLWVLRLHITGFMVTSYFLTLTSFQQKSFYFPLDLNHGTFVSTRKVAVA